MSIAVSTLKRNLQRACEELGLDISFSPSIKISNSLEVEVFAHVANLGSTNGMLILTSGDFVRLHGGAVASANYGYSVLSDTDREGVFDLETYEEMFSDWGWAGEPASKPRWMVDA